MTQPLGSVLDRAGDAVGQYLPRVGGALLVLVLGLLVVRVLCRLLQRALEHAGVDRLSERAGVHDVLARAGLERSLTRLIAFALRLALSIAVIFAALSISGFEFLRQSLNEGVLFLPRLLTALAIVLAGLVLAGWARQRMDRVAYQMDLRGPLGSLAQAAVLLVATIMALGQLGIPTQILTVLAGIAAGGAALGVALAFGLGSREVARDISAGRVVGGTYRVGQTVTVAGAEGEIVAIESACTVLSAPDGRTLRVPHHLFLEGVVAAEGEARPAD